MTTLADLAPGDLFVTEDGRVWRRGTRMTRQQRDPERILCYAVGRASTSGLPPTTPVRKVEVRRVAPPWTDGPHREEWFPPIPLLLLPEPTDKEQDWRACPQCNGNGQISVGFGFPDVTDACVEDCDLCLGIGYVQ